VLQIAVRVEGFSMIGTTISHYRITEKLGAGGMGEVYRAEDTKLDRQVAIKVLPDIFSLDPERLARFEREAKLLASLNHPNIAAIYGLEEAAGKRFLVLELVEGETLAQRIAKGPLPVEESLKVCRQIAEGLEAAHEKGIIHRDLKPANVKVTPEGKVKVLDFGLAKAFHAEPSAEDIAHSPTISEMTRPGVILGTAAYMSPEQARGKSVDKRADIWAFGCVLYECLTGKRTFQGDTITEILASILKSEPDWQALPPTTPWRVKNLLHQCLTKDPRERLHDIADVRIEIEGVSASPDGSIVSSGTAAIETARRTSSIMWFAGLTGLIVVVLATGLLYQWLRGTAAEPTRQVIRTLVAVAPADRLQSIPGDAGVDQRPSQTAIALSPDGRLLAFSAVRGDRQQLYLRSIDQLEANPIADSEGGASPFFSPDGKWIGFWAKGELKKIGVAGGPATTICRTGQIFGASWGEDDQIVFAETLSGLFQVAAAGGTPRPVTTLDRRKGEVSHRLPHVLPGGKAVLFTAITHWMPDWDEAAIEVQPLPSGERRVLTHGADARYVPSGHLVFVRSGTLVAVPFDVQRLKVTGGEVTVVSDVMQAANTPAANYETGAGQLAVSSSGLLVYATGGVHRDNERSLVWVDRSGKVQPLPLPPPPRAYFAPHLSPDGQRVVLWSQGRERIVWVYDLAGGTLTRVTTEGRNSRAIWTPDGRRVTFASAIDGPEYAATKTPDGSGDTERLSAEGEPSSWSPNGRVLSLVTSTVTGTSSHAIWLLLLGEPQPRRFLNSRFNETYPEFSPDGRWIAYVSDETGRPEVYIQPYPGPGQRRQLSDKGGIQPAWAKNGRELLYTAFSDQGRTQMKSVPLAPGTALAAGAPQLLWEGRFSEQSNTRGYDVTPDGQRFLMVQTKDRPPTPVTQLVVVQNWFEELKQKVPSGKR
jgi:serine/threonine-protein kinase